MKYTYITVSDKAIRETLHQFIWDELEDEDTDEHFKFLALNNGAKRGDECEAVGCVIHDLLFSLVGAVNKQGPEKVLKTLERMMKDE